jgi:hypothetical protein
VQQEIHVLVLEKSKDTYIFLFDDKHRNDLLSVIHNYACNDDVNFSWYDAAILTQRVVQTVPPH